jgi:hypothetical protein
MSDYDLNYDYDLEEPVPEIIVDKVSALQIFWSTFGINAYPSINVPEKARSDLLKKGVPYITYDIVLGLFDQLCYMTGQVHYNVSLTGIGPLVEKQQFIVDVLKRGGTTVPYRDGIMIVNLSSPAVQLMTEENDAIKKAIINIVVEFTD